MGSMSLSLYVIEDSLAELLSAREDLAWEVQSLSGQTLGGVASQEHMALLKERRAELNTVERTLREYVTLEVKKADNIHRYLTTAKAILAARKVEAKKMTEGAKALEASIERLEQLTMTALAQGNKTRLDGSNGRYLLRKKNGSVAPLQVDGWDDDKGVWFQDPVLPDEYMDVTVTMPLSDWKRLLEQPNAPMVDATVKGAVPSNKRLRVKLAEVCAMCGGDLEVAKAIAPQCECAGTGKGIVPGARLTERGEHLECK